MNNTNQPVASSNFYVTQLRRLVLLFTAWHAVRLWTAIVWRDVLAEHSARPGMWYNVVSGILWVIVGLGVWWSLVRDIPGTRKWLLGASAVYTVWYWSEGFLLQQPRANWAFMISVNLVVLILIYIFSNFIEERGV